MPEAQNHSLTDWIKPLRSPVCPVIVVHGVLSISASTLRWLAPGMPVADWLALCLAIAQIGLLLIWITMPGSEGMGKRILGAAFVVAIMQALQTPPTLRPPMFLGSIFYVPGNSIALAILALPLSFVPAMGLRLMHFPQDSMPPPRRLQFSVRGVLIASVVAALLFALKGIADSVSLESTAVSHIVAAFLLKAAMILIGASIYLTVPLVAVWAVLTPGKILGRLAAAIAGWGLGGMLILYYAQMDDTPRIGMAVGVTAGGIAMLLVTLLGLRAVGYRFVWGLPMNRSTQVEAASLEEAPTA